ncbi:MAG: hypothetical protein WDN04_05810 [Rhodospirillales bacterium]
MIGVRGEFLVGAGDGQAELFGAVGVVFGDDAEAFEEFGAAWVGAEGGVDGAAGGGGGVGEVGLRGRSARGWRRPGG